MHLRSNGAGRVVRRSGEWTTVAWSTSTRPRSRAADHACLSHLARFTLDRETLERADRYAQRTVHWGGARSTMLLKNLPPAALPPARRKGDSIGQWVSSLRCWADVHVRTRKLISHDRCFRMRDALYRQTAAPPLDLGSTGDGELVRENVEGTKDGVDEWIQCETCCRWHVVPPRYGPVDELRSDFRCGDAVWRAKGTAKCAPHRGTFDPKAWAVVEPWLRDLSLRRWKLTFDDTVGFGIVATDTFKPGDRVAHGTAAPIHPRTRHLSTSPSTCTPHLIRRL